MVSLAWLMLETVLSPILWAAEKNGWPSKHFSVKPLIYQQRKKAKFVSLTAETDDNVFMKKKFLYGADSRGNAGYGFWQMAFGSDGTAKG